ncbi:phosphate ABC transporter, periplasmic phosphate-binding protein [gamma proteobacterium HTCC5015]|nr:phosphate ABC transporter, periplasmic phosphate-binding protein [gamma proteobacterium HTCC5015]
MKKILLSAVAALAMGGMTQAVQARDLVAVVGSSTVYPFAIVVAENFGRTGPFKTPKIESTGSGGGMKLFCEGLGVNTPDVTNASRRMKMSEYEMCQENGVKEITEVLIGYDGIVLANARQSQQLDLSLRDIFLALAKDVPNPDGSEELVPNPYKTWNEINKNLPKTEIEVMGPPPTSGTRDAFNELAIEGGCKTFPWLKAIKSEDKNRYKAICRSVREDGAYVEAGENDNLIVQKLEANPDALGVFGFSFLDQNADKVQGSKIGGQAPTFDSIATGDYPVSRPLYFYVKNAHVGKVPGIEGYVREFVSAKASGQEGYLTEKGLIPLSPKEHREMEKSVRQFESMNW